MCSGRRDAVGMSSATARLCSWEHFPILCLFLASLLYFGVLLSPDKPLVSQCYGDILPPG